MTTSTPIATTSTYFVSIPLQAYYSVTLEGLPSDLSNEELLARITADVLTSDGELSYPTKHREFVSDALQLIQDESDDICIEECVAE